MAWLALAAAAATGAAAVAVAAAVRGCSDQRIKYEAADTCQFSDSSPSSDVPALERSGIATLDHRSLMRKGEEDVGCGGEGYVRCDG